MSKLTPSRATRRGAILGTLALGGAAILSIKACADHPGRIWRSLCPHDADDMAQEAFSRAWDAAPNWPADGAPFAAWLYRVASNLAIDLLRREKRRPVTSLEAASMIADMAPVPSAAVLQVELASAVRAALLELPERQRLAVELVHLESRSGAETAALLGTSIGALEGLLSRARRELRIVLAQRGLAAAKDWDEGLS